MRFDSNQAWKEAAAAVSANREVLLALAGVFLVLPAFVLAVLAPQPEAAAGAGARAMMAQMNAYYLQNAPWLIGLALVELVGTLAMLTLFTDRARPTVGEALRLALGGMLTVIGAQVLLALAMALGLALPLGLAAASHVGAIVALVGAACAVGAIYVSVRVSLVSAAVMVDRLRNPVAALRRSWALTQGNVVLLLVFYVLLGLAFVVAMIAVQALTGLGLALVLHGEGLTLIEALLSSVLQAAMAVYFVAVVAATYRQLAGPSAQALSEPFA